MNRLQNELQLLSGIFSSDIPNNIGINNKVIYEEKNTTYIDIHDNTDFISNKINLYGQVKKMVITIYIL